MKRIVIILIVGIVSAAACKKADNNFTARISFLNGAIGAGNFSIKSNADAIVSNIPFDSLKLYNPTPSGTFSIGFFQDAATSPVLSFTTNLESGRDYTCFLYDSANGKGQLFLEKDGVPANVTEGKCAIRFFSLVPGTTSLLLQNDTSKILLNAKAFNNYTNTFEEADTTSRQLKILQSGIVAAIDSVNKPLKAGKIYTIFLTGSIAGTGAQKPKMIFWEHN